MIPFSFSATALSRSGFEKGERETLGTRQKHPRQGIQPIGIH